MPMSFEGFSALGGLLEEIAGLPDAMVQAGYVEEMAKEVKQRARAKLGTYQPGWPELSEKTKANRRRLGQTANKPLLASRRLWRDIDYHMSDGGARAVVGVPAGAVSAAYAETQELGDWALHIPPRPFLRPAVMEMRAEITGNPKAVLETLVSRLHGTAGAASGLGVSQRTVQRYVTAAQQRINIPIRRLFGDWTNF